MIAKNKGFYGKILLRLCTDVVLRIMPKQTIRTNAKLGLRNVQINYENQNSVGR